MLVTDVVEEVLDVLVVKDALEEEVLPQLVELQLPTRTLIVDGLIQVDPQLLEVLEAVLQLLIAAHDHVEDLLVLLLPIEELLQTNPALFDILPGLSFCTAADVLVLTVAAIEVAFHLLLES